MKAKFINNYFHIFLKDTLIAVFEHHNDYIDYVFRVAGGKC